MSEVAVFTDPDDESDRPEPIDLEDARARLEEQAAPRRRGRAPATASETAASSSESSEEDRPEPRPRVPKPEPPVELKIEECPRDPDAAWAWVVQNWCPFKGLDPRSLRITIFRLIGRDETAIPPHIEGRWVLGEPNTGTGPGEALMNYIIDLYHRDPGTANSYYYKVYDGTTGLPVKKSEPFRLDSWASIDARRRAVAEVQKQQGATGQVAYTPPWNRPAPGFAPAMFPQPLPSHAGGAVEHGVNVALHEELGFLRARERALAEELERARAEGRAPDPSRVVVSPVTPPPASPVARADDDAARELRMMTLMRQMLAEHGIRPQTEQERIAAMLKTEREETLKAMLALIDAKIPPVPPPSSNAAAQTVQDAGESINTLVANIEKLEASKRRVRKALGLPEEDEEERATTPSQIIVEDKKKEEEGGLISVLKTIKEFLPPGAGMAALTIAEQATKGSPLGETVAQVKEAIVSAQASRRVVPQGGGWGKPGA